MKILIIMVAGSSGRKAHDIQVENMVREFSKAGHAITTVIARNPGIPRMAFMGYLFAVAKMVIMVWLHSFVRYNGVYCRDIPSLIVAYILFSSRVYYEAHGVPKRFNRLMNFIFRRIDGVITISEALRKEYGKRGARRVIMARDGC